MNVLVTAASQESATAEIAEAIAAALSKRGVGTTVTEPDRVVDVRRYDAFVIGSAGAVLAIGGLAVLDDRFIPGRAADNAPQEGSAECS